MNGFLKLVAKAVIGRIPVLDRTLMASAGYRVLSRDQALAVQAGATGWHARRSAARQANAYSGLLSDLRAGTPRLDFQVAVQAVRATGFCHPSLLDVGCGNGYYSEAFARLMADALDYTGLDYSSAMVDSARAAYPNTRFIVGDATKLQFPDSAFDIVMNGVALMHILDFVAAIREAARVARSHVIFHSVPVFADHHTTYLFKYAYGEPVVEVVFDEKELLDLFSAAGLTLLQKWIALEYDVAVATGHHSRSFTYLCRKT
jgi:ubiquinone/menaquinone biosynthesis C-methylase UbiE